MKTHGASDCAARHVMLSQNRVCSDWGGVSRTALIGSTDGANESENKCNFVLNMDNTHETTISSQADDASRTKTTSSNLPAMAWRRRTRAAKLRQKKLF